MAIKTEDCKKAIVALIQTNKGLVLNPFSESDEAFADPALKEKNWKRMEKRKAEDAPVQSPTGAKNFRLFDCTPYDDQLRAYVFDDGVSILSIDVVGELTVLQENKYIHKLFDVVKDGELSYFLFRDYEGFKGKQLFFPQTGRIKKLSWMREIDEFRTMEDDGWLIVDSQTYGDDGFINCVVFHFTEEGLKMLTTMDAL